MYFTVTHKSHYDEFKCRVNSRPAFPQGPHFGKAPSQYHNHQRTPLSHIIEGLLASHWGHTEWRYGVMIVKNHVSVHICVK